MHHLIAQLIRYNAYISLAGYKTAQNFVILSRCFSKDSKLYKYTNARTKKHRFCSQTNVLLGKNMQHSSCQINNMDAGE